MKALRVSYEARRAALSYGSELASGAYDADAFRHGRCGRCGVVWAWAAKKSSPRVTKGEARCPACSERLPYDTRLSLTAVAMISKPVIVRAEVEMVRWRAERSFLNVPASAAVAS